MDCVGYKKTAVNTTRINSAHDDEKVPELPIYYRGLLLVLTDLKAAISNSCQINGFTNDKCKHWNAASYPVLSSFSAITLQYHTIQYCRVKLQPPLCVYYTIITRNYQITQEMINSCTSENLWQKLQKLQLTLSIVQCFITFLQKNISMNMLLSCVKILWRW